MKKLLRNFLITIVLMAVLSFLLIQYQKKIYDDVDVVPVQEEETKQQGEDGEEQEESADRKDKSYQELGFEEREDGIFYPNDRGEDQTGWQEVDGSWYFFSQEEDTKGRMVTGKQWINEKMYFFAEDGKMQRGWIEYEQDKYYFAVDNGDLVTGLQYIQENNRYYWFDEQGVLWGNFGILSQGEIGLIRETMGRWDESVTEERRAVIARGLYLIGRVTYNQQMRNEPDTENPTYLDCSSFVGNCFYYGAGKEDVLPRFVTDSFLYQSEFKTVAKEELLPGDLFLQYAEGHWQTGNHVGIYLGSLSDGEHVFMECAGDVTGENNIENRGIWITIREDDEIYRRYHGW